MKRKTLIIIFASLMVLISAAILLFVHEREKWMPGGKFTQSFKNYPQLAGAIRQCREVLLFEGLPHPQAETDLFKAEIKNKKTVVLGEFSFYADSQNLTKEDEERLREIFLNPASFEPFRGRKLCGGYHPDWCVQFTDGHTKYCVQFCFGCGELRVWTNRIELYCDVKDDAEKAIKAILSKYRKRRPETWRSEGFSQ